ncbi:TPA: DUF2213 domain-containing protein, partial [Campylobacter coli]|nr:DUF2213 domain-containing protein [Campylobacter coli]
MPVRITGLGKTLRIDDEGTIKNLQQKLQDFSTTDLKTIVEKAKSQKVDINDYVSYKIYDRDPEAFSNDDILEAYQGLPILKDHPRSQGDDGTLLTSENLNKNKIIGAIIKAYRKNEAVWGLARIYDMSLLDELNKFQSTSPAVYSIDIEKPNGVINEQPNVFNHLAFVENGHWDCVDKNPYDAEKLNIITYNNEVIQGDFMTNETAEASKQIDESSEDLKKDVEELKEAESKEAEHFKEMSEDHKNIKEDEEMPLNKVDNE